MLPDPSMTATQGFACPECQAPFRLTIEHLLGGERFACATCGIVLTLDQEASRETLNRLRAYAKTPPCNTGN